MTEVLAPTMIDYAAPELAADHGPPAAAGGGDLVPGVLRARDRQQPGLAVVPGHAHRRRLAGHRAEGVDQPGPVRRSAACCSPAPARPSPPTGASPRSSSTWTSPGITVRPIETMHGERGVLEVFFDDVVVPFDRTLGERGPGLGRGHGPAPLRAQHGAVAPRRVTSTAGSQQLLDVAPPGSLDPVRLGEVTQLLYAFRARSRATQHRMAAGEHLGPETSIDKVLVATPNRRCSTWLPTVLAAEVTVGDDPASDRWRTEFLYSRAASIYGGSAEIQRNIIARRLLDLGSDR